MPRGGKRPGAGRKAGVPNKVTAAREAEIKASGLTPLDYMLGILRDKKQPAERRDDMARAAAPYCHPRLNAIDHGGSIRARMEDELARLEGKRVEVVGDVTEFKLPEAPKAKAPKKRAPKK